MLKAYMMIKSGGSKEPIKQNRSSTYKNTFIQSPMTTRNEIKGFINDLVRQKKSKSTIVPLLVKSKSTLLDETVKSSEDYESLNSTEEISLPHADVSISDTPIVLQPNERESSSVTKTKVNLYPVVTPVIPTSDDIKYFFKAKFASFSGKNNEFMEDKSVMNFAKLLRVYHEYTESFNISDSANITYHPCVGYKTNNDISRCSYFSLHERTYKDILCSVCQSKRSEEMRKLNRIITSPTRTRPFSNLNPEEKVNAYQHRDKKYRYERIKYKRLVSKLIAESISISRGFYLFSILIL